MFNQPATALSGPRPLLTDAATGLAARVARILHELTAAGLVERTPAGSSSLFVLNRDHLAAGAVEILATLRQQLWARIAEHTRSWSHSPGSARTDAPWSDRSRHDPDRRAQPQIIGGLWLR